MEIKIATFQKGTPAQEFLPLITDAHNLRYSHAEKNCLYFQIFRFPYKEMTKAVAGHEDGTVKFMKSYIRAAVFLTCSVLSAALSMPFVAGT